MSLRREFAATACVLGTLSLSALGLSTSGCGASDPYSHRPTFMGRVDGAPSMSCVPDTDRTTEGYTEHMRRALGLAEASFGEEAPPPPASRSAHDLEQWSNGPLRTWLEAKTHSIEAARQELDAASEEDHRQRILAGAIVGLMYEDIMRVLRSVPAPVDLDSEPEIMEIYQNLVRSQARPFLELARSAYRACSLNADRPEGMRHFSTFCRQRLDGLPEEEIREGVTRVEVVRD